MGHQKPRAAGACTRRSVGGARRANRDLHAQADAQVGHAVLAGVARGRDLALDAARAEPARHQHAVRAADARPRLRVLLRLGLLRASVASNKQYLLS